MDQRRSVGILFLAAWIFLAKSLDGCPRKCQCVWRESKITVDCSDQELASIPTDVESDTQVLNISGNNVPVFGRHFFSRLGLANLQHILASRCGLTQIDGSAFNSLTNLVELDLAINGLTEVPSDALNNPKGAAGSLMKLSFRMNQIEVVRTRAFYSLQALTRLDLSENHLSHIEAGAFEGLDNLQRIFLHSNQLMTFSVQDLPPSLHGISVHKNRWNCDCGLRSFRLWLAHSNVPRLVEPVCAGPLRLAGIHIGSLSLSEFACAPQLSPTSMYLTVPRGKNVSIVCRVESDPLSTITWFFNQQQIHSSDHVNSSTYFPYSEMSRIRVVRQDDVIGSGESKSELLITGTRALDNGTYACQAENKAAIRVSNFTLIVTDSDPSSPTILQLKLEYFTVVAVAIIAILIMALISTAIVTVKLCRNRLSAVESAVVDSAVSTSTADKIPSIDGSLSGKYKVAPMVTTKMPRHIQMGTSFNKFNPRPDLLEKTESAMMNTMTTNTSSSQGSYKLAMENIIGDYASTRRRRTSPIPSTSSKEMEAGQDFIGQPQKQQQPQSYNVLLSSFQPQQQPVVYPSDYGLPIISPMASLLSLQPILFQPNVGEATRGHQAKVVRADEQYPIPPSAPFRSPYIHTSADSGPIGIMYQPIYEAIQPRQQQPQAINEDDALSRLSNLVSTEMAPLAKPDDTSSSYNGSDVVKSRLLQELEQAFNSLDQEMANEASGGQQITSANV